jgi:phytanoyl-CoA hydroxylase
MIQTLWEALVDAVAPAERNAWRRDGYFIRRGFMGGSQAAAIEAELVDLIRDDPPSAHPGRPAYVTASGLLVQPERQVPAGAVVAEDFVAKVFNAHTSGKSAAFTASPEATAIVASLLGPDIDAFQSQFILKNPGAWGQPWHQDSHYFHFDRQPQVGLWLALTEASLANGCLHVIPGSHTGDLLAHGPDKRAGANQGYLEIDSPDGAPGIPVLMAPGDLLVFHSFLVHRSTDNSASNRRAALVLHYGVAGTKNLAPPDMKRMQDLVTRWVPVRREGLQVGC